MRQGIAFEPAASGTRISVLPSFSVKRSSARSPSVCGRSPPTSASRRACTGLRGIEETSAAPGQYQRIAVAMGDVRLQRRGFVDHPRVI